MPKPQKPPTTPAPPMRYELYHYHHLDPDTIARVTQAIRDIFTSQGSATTMADLKDIKDRVTELQAAVAAETTVEQGVATLVTGLATQVGDLKTQLAEAIKGNDPAAMAEVVTSLDAMATTINANVATLSSAVAAVPA